MSGKTIFGLLLVIGSGMLLFANEGRSARTAAALGEGAGLVTSAAVEKMDPALEGKLIHVAGKTAATQPMRDPDFGFEVTGLKLTRKVEMFQWRESSQGGRTATGGGPDDAARYIYRGEWSQSAIDSSKFRNARDHRNPPMPDFASRAIYPSDATLGAFAINERVLRQLNPTEKFDAPQNALDPARARLGSLARIEQGIIYSGADPVQPRVGDLRVTYQLLPLTQLSVVARQTQSTLAPFLASNGEELLLAETGIVDARVMFKHDEDANTFFTWALRCIGLLLMYFGFRLALSLFTTFGEAIPFVGGIISAGAGLAALFLTLVLAPVVIALAWLIYRPAVTIAVLAIGAGLIYLVRNYAGRNIAPRQTHPTAGTQNARSRLPGAAP